MKLSLIIPIYKVSDELLNRLVNSFNLQKYHNLFECIFIIDEPNPPINYFLIIEKISKDISYKVIKNIINLGSGNTRNIGIENSNAKYVAFIDCDDYILPNYVNTIIDFLQEHDTKLLRINYTENENIEPISTMSNYIDFKKSIIPGWAAYTMVLSRDFIFENNIKFAPGTCYGEDIYFFLNIISNIDTWYEINSKIYFYDRNVENSITNKMHKNYIHTFLAIRKIIKLSKNNIFNRASIKKFKFFNAYIWRRLFKNFTYVLLGMNRDNI